MTTPQSVRYLAAVLGALLVLTSARSVIVTVIVPRPTTNWLNRGTDRLVNLVFRAAARRTAGYRKRDRILSAQAATLLIVWLVVLVRFRSPEPLSSWLAALLTVLDSAALLLSLSPGQVPTVPARLCLRSGFLCLRDIARTMGLPINEQPSRSDIMLTYQEFLDAVAHMQRVGFPIERDPEEAWPDFAGWRINYEQAAYAIGEAMDAPAALWSGPRRFPGKPIPPIRPPL